MKTKKLLNFLLFGLLAISLLNTSFVFGQEPGKSENLTLRAQTPFPSVDVNTRSRSCTTTSCNAPIVWPTMVTGTQVCMSDCNIGASPGPNFAGNNCYDHPNPTVWFQFTTPANAATINVNITSADIANPYFSVFGTANCATYTIYNNGGSCFNGAGGTTSGTVNVPANTTLLIAVSGAAGQTGNFNLCITPQADVSACNVNDAIVVTGTSMGSPLAGPYQPGETVSFCYNILQYTQANCNWLHGIVPSFGDCWDPASFTANGRPVTITTPLQQAGNYCPGAWNWYANGVVGINGNPGTPVGAGWFYSAATWEGGAINPNPNTSWGDGNGMCAMNSSGGGGMGDCEGASSGLSWSVCFNLTVRTDCVNGVNCAVSMKTYADGQTGGWTSLGCVADTPTFFNASAICCGLLVNAGTNVAICSNGSTQLNGSFSNAQGATTVVWTASPAGALAGLSDPNVLNPMFIPPPGITGPVTFTLSVTDLDCTIASQVTVTVNPTPAVTAMTNTVCSGTAFTSTPVNGTNGVVPAGTTYTWPAPVVTGGVTGGAAGTNQTSISGTLTNPTNTPQTATYTVTPTTGSCPGAPFTVTVTVNPRPAITPMTATICTGGTFTSTPANGTNGIVPAGTTYTWSAPVVTGGMSGGAAGTNQTSISGTLTNPTNTPQTATYTVTPTSGSCVGATFTVTVTVNPAPAITPMTAIICTGGTFTSTPANGTNGVVPAGTTYTWPAPVVTGGMTGGAAGTNQTSISGTLTNPTNTPQTATYTVTPTSGACPGATFTVTVTVNPTPAITPMTAAICTGGTFSSTPANGTNGVVPTGTTYSWGAPVVTGGVTGGAAGTNQSVVFGTLTNPTSSPQTATYTVTPTAGTCVGATFTVTVTVNPTPVITLTPTDPTLCNGTDGSILVSGSGTGNVVWSGTASGNANGVTLPYTIINLASGNYNVTFTDAATGCSSASTPTSLNNPGAPIINSISNYTSCEVNYVVPDVSTITGTNLTGNQAFYSASGGNAADLIAPGTIITPAMSPMTIFVYDNNGACEAQISFVVTVNLNPTASITPDPAVACQGVAIPLFGNPSGGSGVYTSHAWTGDVVILNTTILPNPTVSASTAANVYNLTYTVTDNNNCSGTDNIQVTINPNPVITGTLTVCVGLTTDLSATNTPNATTPWLSSNTSFATVDNNGVVTGVSAGTTQITYTDINGCTNAVNVTVSANPTISLTPTDPTVCNGTDGSIVVNGTGSGTVDWFGTATGSNGSVSLPFTITNLAAGPYDVTFTNAITGCVSNNPSTTLNNPSAPVLASISDTTSCEVDFVVPAIAAIAGTDLTGNQAFYSASGGNAADILASGTVITSAMSPMTIYVYDINGTCSSEVSFVVSVNTNPSVSISPVPASVCAGEDLQLNGNPSGGSGVYSTHAWSNTGSGSLSDAGIENPLFNNGSADDYLLTYTVTDDNGCIGSGDLTVTVVANPTIDPIGPISACGTFALPTITGTDLTGNQAYYNDTQANGGTVVTGSITSSTVLYMYDGASGCSDEVMVSITINALPTVTSITGNGQYCEDELVGDVLVSVTGSADWTIDYTLGGVSQTATGSSSPISLGNAAGVYTLTSVTDANCTNTATGSVTIVVFPTPSAPIVSDDASYCSSVAFAPMTATGGSGTMTWYSDEDLLTVYGTGGSIAPSSTIGSTTYYVTETSNGCEGPYSSIVITVESCEIILSTAITPDGDGNNDSWIIPNLDQAYPDAVVRIYNRWGGLIFEHISSTMGNYNDNAWDGRYQGNALPVGSYFFVIEFNDVDNDKIQGAVSIILQ